MDAVSLTEFPFVEELPKREARKVLSIWERFKEFAALQDRVGPIAPLGLCAKVLNVSRSRVYEMKNDGLLEVIDWEGHLFVTKRSIQAYAERERLTGRPVQALNYRESLRASWDDAHGK